MRTGDEMNLARALAADYRAGLSAEDRAREDAEVEREHNAEIDMWRGQLDRALDQARVELLKAAAANGALRSPGIYDIEFAEGDVGSDVAAFIDDAARMICAADALRYRATR